MLVSLNEFEGALTKAVKGVGLPFGIGQEAASSLRQAAGLGIDSLGAYLAALESCDSGQASGLSQDGPLRPDRGDRCSALLAGPAVCDALAVAVDGGEKTPSTGASGVDVPCVVLIQGLTLAAALNAGLCLAWRAGGGARATLTYPAGGLGEGQRGSLPPGPLDIRVGLQLPEHEPKPAAAPYQPQGGLTVAESEWRRLQSYAGRLLVESTQASRLSGAGAGLLDSD